MLEWDVVSLYQKIPGLMDKFIIAMVYELDYDKSTAASCLGISNGYISQRLEKIKKILRKEYNIMDTK